MSVILQDGRSQDEVVLCECPPKMEGLRTRWCCVRVILQDGRSQDEVVLCECHPPRWKVSGRGGVV